MYSPDRMNSKLTNRRSMDGRLPDQPAEPPPHLCLQPQEAASRHIYSFESCGVGEGAAAGTNGLILERRVSSAGFKAVETSLCSTVCLAFSSRNFSPDPNAPSAISKIITTESNFPCNENLLLSLSVDIDFAGLIVFG